MYPNFRRGWSPEYYCCRTQPSRSGRPCPLPTQGFVASSQPPLKTAYLVFIIRLGVKLQSMNTPAQSMAPSAPPLGRRAHRALGSRSRVRLLEAIRADGPLDAEQLVARVGLHLNTVRAHLNVLRDAGLIGVRSVPVVGAGRPRLAFTATDLVADEGHPGAYRLLARILTSSLQGREDGRDEAMLAGIPAGRRLV